MITFSISYKNGQTFNTTYGKVETAKHTAGTLFYSGDLVKSVKVEQDGEVKLDLVKNDAGHCIKRVSR